MMIVEIKNSTANGQIRVPSSKSYTHRFIIAAILTQEEVTLSKVSLSNDIEATLSFLAPLGYDYEIHGDILHIKKVSKPIGNVFNANESGSTLRFMIPVLMYYLDEFTIYGKEKLFSRGLTVYEDLFKLFNIKYELGKDQIHVKGHLPSNDYLISGRESSQYFSGMLFYLPLLKKNSSITVNGKLESEPYVDLTIDVLDKFGIKIRKENNRYFINGNSKYLAHDDVIEGDYSNGAILDVLNLIGGKVELLGLDNDSLQGDRVYKQYFEELKEANVNIDISNCIDLGPILFVVASLFNGGTFTGIHRLRIKESDRIREMFEELEKFGVNYLVEENKVTIYKSNLHKPDCPLNGHNDHRIVMSLSILLTKFGGCIEGAEAVSKSYPNFFNDLKKVGIEVIENDK